MDGTGKDASQHNPKEGGRAKLRSHDGADDGPNTRNVEELNEIDAPRLHRHVIHAVGHGGGGGGTLWVDAEDLLNELSVNEIAEQQHGKGNEKGCHVDSSFVAAKIEFFVFVFLKMRIFVANTM